MADVQRLLNQENRAITEPRQKPMDWVPEPYESPNDLPMEMPESLRRHIEDVFVDKDQTTTDVRDAAHVGETPADTESLGTAELHPWQGIPFMYFPVRQDSNPQTIPLLALKLNNPQPGVLISIRCHFWAKNLDSQHIAARIQLLV
ncbi:Sodium/potassium-transporting ATPase subunit beta-2 [Chionoecetes opilio]|uniref:Sodium/potassium-transporting ATPase subunit beta-2 n=1 Tax=Chionoecetes opilio TaxID=41210 RepID=A0A8J4YA70_CHIOP|nr:Sodium/potassium-transporting ATPase subunit beta-2 [Chionoecetes opilio]